MSAGECCGSEAEAPVPPPTARAAATGDAVFKALASGPRRQLLHIIAAHTSAGGGGDEVCACKLADALDLSPSTISHHMSALTKAGLVSATRRGLWVYYRLERATLARIAAELVSL